ncbi:MAG: hypothetical protein ACREFX_04185, partial [Opitutaceae bacterium]
TTIAGRAGRTGSADGAGSAARFDLTAGLRVDAAGDIYVCDQDTGTVRRITPNGAVSTVAGSAGDLDNVDGLPFVSRFYNPTDLALVGNGVMYLVDGGNFDVRRLDLGAPQITESPAGATIVAGQEAAGPTFSVGAVGAAGISSYQWQSESSETSAWTDIFDGPAASGTYSGSSTAVLTVSDASVGLNQTLFRCVVSGPNASTASAGAILTVIGAPVVLTASPGGKVLSGSTVDLQITTAGTGVSYQWSLNDSPIPGATGASYSIADFQSASAGDYQVTATNSYGSVTTGFALSLSTARLLNLSARAGVQPGSGVLTAGFVISGSGEKQVLIRGVGPALAPPPYNVADVLPDPSLALFDRESVEIASDIGWGTPPQVETGAYAGDIQPATSALFGRVYAFALPAGSADSALVATLPAAPYTAQITGASGDTGNALAEIYDADSSNPPDRLANISARAVVASGAPLVAGFVIGGTGEETVLIRAIGPGLTPFGVPGVLDAPVLTLYDSNHDVVASNIGWSNASTLGGTTYGSGIQAATSSILGQVGAFSVPAGSADCAMVANLPPGSYTAQVTAADGSSGVALVEIYEVLQ